MTRRAILLVLLPLLAGCEARLPSLEDAPAAGAEPAPLESITRPADGAAVHLVRIVQRGDRYAFEPDELAIPPGDVVRFVMTGSQPESVVFDASAADSAATRFILANRLHLGVLLTDAGQAHDVSFRDAPPGRYPFHSLPHADRGMRGVVVLRPPS